MEPFSLQDCILPLAVIRRKLFTSFMCQSCPFHISIRSMLMDGNRFHTIDFRLASIDCVLCGCQSGQSHSGLLVRHRTWFSISFTSMNRCDWINFNRRTVPTISNAFDDLKHIIIRTSSRNKLKIDKVDNENSENLFSRRSGGCVDIDVEVYVALVLVVQVDYAMQNWWTQWSCVFCTSMDFDSSVKCSCRTDPINCNWNILHNVRWPNGQFTFFDGEPMNGDGATMRV